VILNKEAVRALHINPLVCRLQDLVNPLVALWSRLMVRYY